MRACIARVHVDARDSVVAGDVSHDLLEGAASVRVQARVYGRVRAWVCATASPYVLSIFT